jgi:hypothetical protein
MKLLLYIFSLLLITPTNAQTINVDDPNYRTTANLSNINGQPFNTMKYVKVIEGTVYVPNEFSKATVLLKK